MDGQKEPWIEKIISFYLGEISDAAKEELEEWVSISEEHRAEFKRVVGVCHRLRLTMTDDRGRDMRENVLKKCLQCSRKKHSLRLLRLAACAAMLVLALGTGYIFYSNHAHSRNSEMKKIGLLQAKHGERMAMLRSASGEEWVLSDRNTTKLEIGEHVVLKGDSILPVDKPVQGIVPRTEEYHKLMVPPGGEYNLTLADGTNVWLNSGSELKFPVRFAGNVREVYLKGEAFFEVVSDSLHPFSVKAGEAEIKVVGTAFNVMNYADEDRLEVALQKGKVEFTAVGTQQVYSLKPGYVVALNKKNNGVSISEKDLTLMGTWRSGYFYFEDMPLEELVVKLERWYQVKFVFADEETKQLRFTGAVKKYRELNYVLKIIEKTKDIVFMDFGEEVRIMRK